MKALTVEESWNLQYRIRPYLENANSQEMQSRLDDILRNLYCFTADCKVGVLSPADGGSFWAQKLSDFALECYRRDKRVEDYLPKWNLPFKPETLEIVKRNRHLASLLERRPILCKYGYERFMEPLLKKGSIRVSPASYFRNPEHDKARRDDELFFRTFISPYDYDLGLASPDLIKNLPERNWGYVEYQKPVDHYIYCLGTSFDFRYFFDFAGADGIADCCVLIHNREEFVRRLISAARERLQGWETRFHGLFYTDPYFMLDRLAQVSGSDIFLIKDFRYMYQREHRLIALPPSDKTKDLDHLYLELGNLESIAELIKLTT